MSIQTVNYLSTFYSDAWQLSSIKKTYKVRDPLYYSLIFFLFCLLHNGLSDYLWEPALWPEQLSLLFMKSGNWPESSLHGLITLSSLPYSYSLISLKNENGDKFTAIPCQNLLFWHAILPGAYWEKELVNC